MDDRATSPSGERTDVATSPDDDDPEHQDRADRVAERIAVPVLIAALASVPAVFLTLLDDPYQTIGEGLNTLSGAVLIAETLVLLAVSERRWTWIKRNKWLVLLALAIIPAVVFAIGPVQLLRLARVVGALRIIRVKRIFKAGKIVRERAGLNKTWERVIGVAVTVLCAAFVAVMLVDPTSTRQLNQLQSESQDAFGNVIGRLGWIGIAVAGIILFAATYIVWSNRRKEGVDDGANPDADSNSDDERAAADDAPYRDIDAGGADDTQGAADGRGARRRHGNTDDRDDEVARASDRRSSS